MTTSAFETPLSQDAPSPDATAVATRTPFGTDPSGNEAFLAVAQSLSHTGSFGWSVASGELDWSAETFNIFEHDRAITPTLEMILSRIHPGDRDLVQQTLDRVIETKDDFDLEHRLLMPDGSVKHLHVLARALSTPSGNLEFVGAVTDVTKQVQTETTLEKALQEIKRRNEALRASEHNLDLIINTIPALAWSARPDGSAEFFNQHYLEYVGLSAEQVKDWGWTVAVHPDDLNGLAGSWQSIMASGERGESEARLRRFDGEYRWFLFRANPLCDESGNIVKWFGINTDIEDRKVAEQRLQNENIVLREQVDRFSMFEEIVGASTALSTVLARVAKVAPTDSTVLITGETGTGKELIARAIHKRSRRAQRAFVSVNCAALAPSLISSELFGHEKGAFTGATQRRIGRFELANGGTLFLDEVGELPLDTQIALLRVLQEREFERVGGKERIKVDVRIVAATNRDLNVAQTDGTFRTDLFYRLNVFPVHVPPLRERREDIALLLEYFLHRYAHQARKVFKSINKQTLNFFEAYDWPGNIRELQNIVERSVILSPDDVFCVDNSWLPSIPCSKRTPQTREDVSDDDSEHERKMIVSALTQSRGRISGPQGAAAALRLPPATLEARIKKLSIRKNRFKLG